MYGDWLLTGVIIALFIFLVSLVQWQSKRLDSKERKDIKLMDLWLYLIMLQEATPDDAELGKFCRGFIKQGFEDEELEKYMERMKEKQDEKFTHST